MAHEFAIELVWRFPCPEERHGPPSFGHRYYPAQSPVPGVSKKVIWCVSIALGPCSSSYLCAPRPSISLQLDLVALPPSPMSPSPTQASSASLHTICREAGHAPTCAYCLLSFPICPLGSNLITPSHCFFLDDALNPPSSSPPPHPHRHVFAAGIAVSTPGSSLFLFLQTSPAVHYFMSTTNNRTKLPRRALQARAQRRRLAVQQQSQPKSLSPATLRTLQRL